AWSARAGPSARAVLTRGPFYAARFCTNSLPFPGSISATGTPGGSVHWSMCPEQIGGMAIRAEVCRTAARIASASIRITARVGILLRWTDWGEVWPGFRDEDCEAALGALDPLAGQRRLGPEAMAATRTREADGRRRRFGFGRPARDGSAGRPLRRAAAPAHIQ